MQLEHKVREENLGGKVKYQQGNAVTMQTKTKMLQYAPLIATVKKQTINQQQQLSSH